MSIHLTGPDFRSFCRTVSPQATTRRYTACDCQDCRVSAILAGHTDTEGITAADQISIERAGAHAIAESVLEPMARWMDYEVTDLSIARLLRALEGGTEVWRDTKGRWHAPVGTPIPHSLGANVREAIRTGLVTDYFGALLPAYVHGARWDGELGRRVTVCQVPGEGMGPKRVRLHTALPIIDCPDCIARL